MEQQSEPLELVVTGEAEYWLDALKRTVGPQWLRIRVVRDGDALLVAVQTSRVDAVVVDDQAYGVDSPELLIRKIRRVRPVMPVILVSDRSDRQSLEDAMRLAVFTVLARPVGFEMLLRQIHGIMLRLAKELYPWENSL
ncbi:MAG: response regulator [Phycisphaerales bacterium]|nr:response regulator [Phycisphaerales bacterium]